MTASYPATVAATPLPAVVLLHSSASSARQWHALAETLSTRFRVVGVDFHGHGERRAWEGHAPMTLADEAGAVAPLLAQEGGAHVIGHSYGGAVALKLAAMQPTLVRSVVAYEPVLFGWLGDGDDQPAHDVVTVAQAIRDRLAMNQKHSAAQRFVDFWSGNGTWQALAGGKQDSIATHMRTVLAHFDALFREPIRRSWLRRLAMPMLLMRGARTVAVMHRLARVLRFALPHARHELLQGMGHMGPITHAAEVNRRIVRFLSAQTPSAPARAPLRERLAAGTIHA